MSAGRGIDRGGKGQSENRYPKSRDADGQPRSELEAALTLAAELGRLCDAGSEAEHGRRIRSTVMRSLGVTYRSAQAAHTGDWTASGRLERALVTIPPRWYPGFHGQGIQARPSRPQGPPLLRAGPREPGMDTGHEPCARLLTEISYGIRVDYHCSENVGSTARSCTGRRRRASTGVHRRKAGRPSTEPVVQENTGFARRRCQPGKGGDRCR